MSCNEIEKIQTQKRILKVVGVQSSLNTMHKQILNTNIEKNFKNNSYQRYLNKKKILLCKESVIETAKIGNKTRDFNLNCNCKCSSF